MWLFSRNVRWQLLGKGEHVEMPKRGTVRTGQFGRVPRRMGPVYGTGDCRSGLQFRERTKPSWTNHFLIKYIFFNFITIAIKLKNSNNFCIFLYFLYFFAKQLVPSHRSVRSGSRSLKLGTDPPGMVPGS